MLGLTLISDFGVLVLMDAVRDYTLPVFRSTTSRCILKAKAVWVALDGSFLIQSAINQGNLHVFFFASFLIETAWGVRVTLDALLHDPLTITFFNGNMVGFL